MRYNKREEIGKLRERIIVQSVSRSASTTGFGTETWSNLAEVWAIVDYKGINKEDQVAKLAEDKRMYHLLESVGTKPNVFYHVKVRNT